VEKKLKYIRTSVEDHKINNQPNPYLTQGFSELHVIAGSKESAKLGYDAGKRMVNAYKVGLAKMLKMEGCEQTIYFDDWRTRGIDYMDNDYPRCREPKIFRGHVGIVKWIRLEKEKIWEKARYNGKPTGSVLAIDRISVKVRLYVIESQIIKHIVEDKNLYIDLYEFEPKLPSINRN
jgi:hypothetical protein